MSDEKECFWVEIDGIPSNYRSHHLRFFFSDFVEGDKFSLCHFLHRKSSQDGFYVVSANFPSKKLRTQFIHRYGETHWTHSEGDKILPNKCFIRSIQAKDAVERVAPGIWMPKGNIGTSTAFFKPLISSCKLPPKIITKLRLKFNSKHCKYGYVSPYHGPPSLEQDNGMEDLIEEWDRHESLHDDVSARRVLSGDPDNVPGTKERTFEDEVEVTWDKGSSGLVFNTDASSFWKSAEAEAAEADDWDVDMSQYEGGNAPGDKDSQDYCSMRSFYKQANDSVFHRRKRIGGFERHTKGIGGRLLKKQGWAIGDGLGARSSKGIPEPIDNKGQTHRFGFGFKATTRLPFMDLAAARRKNNYCIISTVYDDPKETDPEEKVFERNPDNYLKHRHK